MKGTQASMWIKHIAWFDLVKHPNRYRLYIPYVCIHNIYPVRVRITVLAHTVEDIMAGRCK